MAPNLLQRPEIAIEMTRTLAAIAWAADSAHTPLQPTPSSATLAAAAITGLSRANATYHQIDTIVADALTTALLRICDDQIAACDRALSAATGLDRFDGPSDQQFALTAAGFDVTSLDATTLATLPHHPVVDAIARRRTLAAYAARLQDGSVTAEIAAVRDTIGALEVTIDDVIAAADAAGLVGDDLAWAQITFESTRHINLVWQQVNRLSRAFPNREPDDLFGYGWRGLRTALRKYDPSLGYAFSTYAVTKIRGEVRDGVRAESPIPKRLSTFLRKVNAATEELSAVLGRSPSLEEVAEAVGTDVDALGVLPRLASEASLEERLEGYAATGGMPDWMIDHCDPAEIVTDNLRAEAVERALSKLPEREAAAVRLLVMDGLSPAEAREHTGATARQLRQWKERGLAALRDELTSWN
jgi:RNA polymerase sigma factor FliA